MQIVTFVLVFDFSCSHLSHAIYKYKQLARTCLQAGALLVRPLYVSHSLIQLVQLSWCASALCAQQPLRYAALTQFVFDDRSAWSCRVL